MIDDTITIRPEQPGDASAIFAVHAAAFETESEARLVDGLRAAGRLTVSEVAVIGGCVVGHVAFSPISIERLAPQSGLIPNAGLGLAPVAVLPSHQGRGIGSMLIRSSLATIQAEHDPVVIVVLGDPKYYSRFGFTPACAHRLDNEYGATDAFMAIVKKADALPVEGGLVRYALEFADLES